MSSIDNVTRNFKDFVGGDTALVYALDSTQDSANLGIDKPIALLQNIVFQSSRTLSQAGEIGTTAQYIFSSVGQNSVTVDRMLVDTGFLPYVLAKCPTEADKHNIEITSDLLNTPLRLQIDVYDGNLMTENGEVSSTVVPHSSIILSNIVIETQSMTVNPQDVRAIMERVAMKWTDTAYL